MLVLLVPVGQSSVIDLALMPSLLLSSHVLHVAAVFQAHHHKIILLELAFRACVFSLGFHDVENFVL